MRIDDIPAEALAAFRRGGVIPAHPLALTADRPAGRAPPAGAQPLLSRRRRDRPRGRRPHHPVRDPRGRALRQPSCAWRARRRRCGPTGRCLMIAGAIGATAQAVAEAEQARAAGYHAVLLSLAGHAGEDVDALMRSLPRGRRGDAGGRVLPPAGGRRQWSCRRPFWRGFAGLDNVLGIKIAPVQPVPHAGRNQGRGRRAGGGPGHPLYRQRRPHRRRPADPLHRPARRAAGDRAHPRRNFWGTGRSGPGGRSRCWTGCRRSATDRSPADLLALDAATTDANAALFDARNDFHGVIAGLHENPCAARACWRESGASTRRRTCGPGQAVEIDRVIRDWPELTDDAFVADKPGALAGRSLNGGLGEGRDLRRSPVAAPAGTGAAPVPGAVRDGGVLPVPREAPRAGMTRSFMSDVNWIRPRRERRPCRGRWPAARP